MSDEALSLSHGGRGRLTCREENQRLTTTCVGPPGSEIRERARSLGCASEKAERAAAEFGPEANRIGSDEGD